MKQQRTARRRLLQLRQNFLRIRETPHLFFGKKQSAFLFHFENAAAACDQLDLAARETLLNFRLQTGGAREVVSNRAIFNRDFHASIYHQDKNFHPATAGQSRKGAAKKNPTGAAFAYSLRLCVMLFFSCLVPTRLDCVYTRTSSV